MRIYSALTPSKQITISVLTDTDSIYMQGPTTGGKWLAYSTNEYEEMDADNSDDASLYGFLILESLFDDSKALFKGVAKDSIEKIDEYDLEGSKYVVYKVDISVPDYINALTERNESTNSVEDAKKILKDAVMTAKFHVNTENNYIAKIDLEAKNLSQIVPEEAKAVILSSTHDINLTADISRFNVPVSITVPDASEILNGDEVEINALDYELLQ